MSEPHTQLRTLSRHSQLARLDAHSRELGIHMAEIDIQAAEIHGFN